MDRTVNRTQKQSIDQIRVWQEGFKKKKFSHGKHYPFMRQHRRICSKFFMTEIALDVLLRPRLTVYSLHMQLHVFRGGIVLLTNRAGKVWKMNHCGPINHSIACKNFKWGSFSAYQLGREIPTPCEVKAMNTVIWGMNNWIFYCREKFLWFYPISSFFLYNLISTMINFSFLPNLI